MKVFEGNKEFRKNNPVGVHTAGTTQKQLVERAVSKMSQDRGAIVTPHGVQPINRTIGYTKPEPPKPIDPAVQEAFFKSVCSYHTDLEEAKKSTAPFRFVMGGNGIFKLTENAIGSFVQKVESIPGLPQLHDTAELKIPKIPYDLFLQTVAFFRKIMDLHHDSEAMLQFYYDAPNKKYIVNCPKQRISGAHIDFERDQEMDSKYLLVMDIHSHNKMGAFFSGTDNADERETRIYGVIGNLDRVNYEYKFRVIINGAERLIQLGDIFDVPESKVTVPDEWLNKCEKKYSGSTTYPVTYPRPTSVVGHNQITSKTDAVTKNDIINDYEYPGYGYGCYGGNNIDTDVDVTVMSKYDRMDFIREMLRLYKEELAYVIYSENSIDEIHDLCEAFELDEMENSSSTKEKVESAVTDTNTSK